MDFPLRWPSGQERHSYARKVARFKTNFVAARENLLDELRKLGSNYVVISTNMLTVQGPKGAVVKTPPVDPGVAVYFGYQGEAHVFACDKWNTVRDNMQAIAKTIEALRGLARWGSANTMKRAVNAFKALPASGEDWRSVLRIRQDVTDLGAVKTRYRALAQAAHPDKGGSEHQMIRINQAWEAAQRELS